MTDRENEPEMALYAVERTYWAPIYQQVTIRAASPEAAMQQAMDHESWDSAKTAYEECRGTHITGCWAGSETYNGDPLDIPAHLTASPSDAPAPFIHDQLFKDAPEMASVLRTLVSAWDENMGPEPYPQLMAAGAPRNAAIEQARSILARLDAFEARCREDTPAETEG